MSPDYELLISQNDPLGLLDRAQYDYFHITGTAPHLEACRMLRDPLAIGRDDRISQ